MPTAISKAPWQWLRAIAGIVLIIFALPVALVAAILTKVGILSGTRDCTPEEFASELKGFADGAENDWAWDDLESYPISDPRLEEIRQEAMNVDLPLRPEGRAKLGELSARAATLSPANRP